LLLIRSHVANLRRWKCQVGLAVQDCRLEPKAMAPTIIGLEEEGRDNFRAKIHIVVIYHL
jgi:hypothetical protein